MEYDKELDASGLACPLPIIRTRKSLESLTTGQVLKVVTTDPGSAGDMQAFATQTGNQLISSEKQDTKFVFYMKKK